jgi:hypothetical protein
MVHVDLPDFEVTAGEQLAITLRSGDFGAYQWIRSGTFEASDPPISDYAGGNWFTWNIDHWVDAFPFDHGFRTYVIPEPASLAMTASAACVVFWGRRRRSS